MGARERWEGCLDPFTVLPWTEDVSWRHGRLFRYLRDNGMLIGSSDLWIAATALVHGARAPALVPIAWIPVPFRAVKGLFEDGSLDVIPSEGTDRFLIFPERDEHQLGAVTTDPPKRQNTEVPGGRAVLSEPSRLQVVEVLLGVGSAGGSPPEARDH